MSGEERKKPMLRASRPIREMRGDTGIPPGGGKDSLYDLEVSAVRSETGSYDGAKALLLEMAGMIRTLKIVLDATNELIQKSGN
ncbi:hypothetical protein [Rhizobium herbae]|uniref:Uncharacterized protein n=1 Tax=Rhizobium herbae TaxID=508661 RepID=A0ABS4EVX7_9HYPH|nr:hypothetical protein [Rhizobium herbae]MBP1862121.1 hypothetical protein [Rhizobium herbae]